MNCRASFGLVGVLVLTAACGDTVTPPDAASDGASDGAIVRDGGPDASTTDAPVSDVPTSDVPTSDVPVSDVPPRDVPVSDVPVSDVPPRDVPVSDVPVSDVPVSDVPASDVPVSDVPVSDGGLDPLPSDCTVVHEPVAGLCGTATCAVTGNAALRCTGDGFGLAVAGAATGTQVSYVDNFGGFHPVLFRVNWSARTGTAERVPTANWPARVHPAPEGETIMAAWSADASDREALAVYERAAGPWRRTVLHGTGYAPITMGNGLRHADGRRSFVYSYGEGTGTWRLAMRTGTTWSQTALADGVPFGRFAATTVNADGSGDATLARWLTLTPDTSSRTLTLTTAGTNRNVYVQRPGTAEAFNHVAVESRATGGPVVAVGLDEGVHVFTPSATGFTDTLVANTARGTDMACPGISTGAFRPGMCSSSSSCTARGTFGGFGSHDLARTADGRVWLAVARQYLDRDYVITYGPPAGPGCAATARIATDRTRTELTLYEVGATLIERTRLTLADGAMTDELDLDAVGNTLHLARLAHEATPSSPPRLRALTVDTSSLR